MALDFTLLIDLGLIILAAAFFGYVAKLLKQPPLISYIIAGLIIGPIGLGSLNISLGGFPIGITTEQIANVAILSELGIAFLLFSIGVETNFRRMLDLRKALVFGGLAQVGIIFGIMFLGASSIGLTFVQSVYLSLILALSSTMIVVKILSDRKEINTLHGRLMIGFLLIEDLVVILALPMLANIEGLSFLIFINIILKLVVLFAAGYLLNRLFLERLMKFSSDSAELFYLTAVAVCFGFIALAIVLEFSIAIGAFVGGLALSTLPQKLEIQANIRGLRDFFATIFFVTLGLQITFGFVNISLAFLALMLLTVFLVKPIVFFFTTYLTGYGSRVSTNVALSLTQISEFSFILLSQGFAAGLGPITQDLYSVSILVIAVSMALTPYFMKYSDSFYLSASSLGEKLFKRKIFSYQKQLDKLSNVSKPLKGHIILFGAGMLGGNIIKFLNELDKDVVIVDNDPEVVFNLMDKGNKVVYGSGQNEEIIDRVNLPKADLVIITIPDFAITLSILSKLKRENPEATVFVRGHHNDAALRLYEEGADFVILPEILAGNMLLKRISEFLEKGKKHTSSLQDEYLRYLKEKMHSKKHKI